ncbi:TIGR02281 family clan AA aspartic protease [Pelomonas sp. KK5]|uniref:retropepsin-like aspartic protease family protein n=1 Tax=Pelomonas sp. KK5 TaxID=1855730 RepID=UPI00097C5D50|nr:TIGR02281 family clan AA aspartic protease [Pelomonas sp. KK5]
MRAAACALVLTMLAAAASAQSVSFNGSLGSRAALLLIDGEPRTVAVGQKVQGVTLVSLSAEGAVVEIDGHRRTLQLGGSPGRVGSGAAPAGSGRQIVLASGDGGHFTSAGSINGRATRFLVDTGATVVALSQAEADRLGLAFRDGRRVLTQTANGTVPANLLTLASVRIGDVEVRNVEAIVVPGQMTHVLLGNSFLTRFQMRRENEVLTLELRY